ncbi:MAG TPA: hypothetical protein PKM63_08375 [Panacibacter sp.]|nr:hypothetical protein [Panacibacter sp.]HNP44282.1 hypothetical protein [Panacibacter sp.]
MKRKYTYAALLLFLIASVSLIVLKYSGSVKAEPTVYPLLPRAAIAPDSKEWLKVKEEAYKLQQQITANPNDAKSLTQLATLYIQEARVTGNYAYYDKASMKLVENALQMDSTNLEALVLKSLLYLSQHHFAEGLEMAQHARNINPYNAFVYGVCVDGNVEMGNYDSAVADADKMLSIRPDIRSYSRASYLREIYGDYKGAIEAMQMAVSAGAPGVEATEWSRVQLGHLYENTGEMKYAEMHYSIALQERPGYAYALAGMARVASSEKDYKKALAYLQQADSSVNDFAIKEAIADTYRSMGEQQKAEAIDKAVITSMTKEAASGNTDASLGHYVDRELAYAYLQVNDKDNALKHAMLEYNRRPDNIDVNECLAWVYYNRGEYDKALTHIKTALKTNSKNPTLLCRAGLIFAKAGDKIVAKATLQNALMSNPNIPEALKMQSLGALQTL